MPLFVRLCLVGLILSTSAACATSSLGRALVQPTETTTDPDARQLATLGQQALALARDHTPGAVLRQVDTDLTRTSFHFTDPGATQVTQVTLPGPDAPSSEWTVQTGLLSPILGISPSQPDSARQRRASSGVQISPLAITGIATAART